MIIPKHQSRGMSIERLVLSLYAKDRGFGHMGFGKTESASFWIGVLTYLKVRGVEDILITVTDNSGRFTDTIKSVFPESTTQIYVVHQIRTLAAIWFGKREKISQTLKHLQYSKQRCSRWKT